MGSFRTHLSTPRTHLRRVAHSSYKRGFSLVEMTVVLAIIAVISAVTISSQSSFNKSIVLANTAYDVALTMRNAQTYGIASKNVNTTFGTGYGLSFTSGATDSFRLFADTDPPVGTSPSSALCHQPPSLSAGNAPDAHPGDCTYNGGAYKNDSSVQTYSLGNKITIGNFCAKTGGAWFCSQSCPWPGSGFSPSTCANTLTQLDIVFTRPDTSATITVNGVWDSSKVYTDACIVVASPQDTVRYITVSKIGQVVANATGCP